jgi:hypothetical protein
MEQLGESGGNADTMPVGGHRPGYPLADLHSLPFTKNRGRIPRRIELGVWLSPESRTLGSSEAVEGSRGRWEAHFRSN